MIKQSWLFLQTTLSATYVFPHLQIQLMLLPTNEFPSFLPKNKTMLERCQSGINVLNLNPVSNGNDAEIDVERDSLKIDSKPSLLIRDENSSEKNSKICFHSL